MLEAEGRRAAEQHVVPAEDLRLLGGEAGEERRAASPSWPTAGSQLGAAAEREADHVRLLRSNVRARRAADERAVDRHVAGVGQEQGGLGLAVDAEGGGERLLRRHEGGRHDERERLGQRGRVGGDRAERDPDRGVRDECDRLRRHCRLQHGVPAVGVGLHRGERGGERDAQAVGHGRVLHQHGHAVVGPQVFGQDAQRLRLRRAEVRWVERRHRRRHGRRRGRRRRDGGGVAAAAAAAWWRRRRGRRRR